MKKNLQKFAAKYLPITAMLLVVAAFFYPVFLKGLIPVPSDIIVGLYYPWFDDTRGFTVGVPVKNNIPSDVVSLIFPQKLFAAEEFRKGIVPLWNNLIFAGTPLLANFQSSVLYPLNILWFFFSTLDSWTMQVMLQPLISLTFTYLLLRNWELSKLSSVFGAVAFSFSGFLLTWLEYNTLYHVMYWLPAVLLVVDKYLKTKNPLFLGGLALAVSFAVLGGYPQIVLYEGLAVFIFLLFRDLKSIPLFAFFALLGFGLSGVQLLPGYELLNLSDRGSDRANAALNEGFIPYQHLVGFLIPDYFGNITTLNWWGVGSYDNFATFVGVTTFVLSLFAFKFMWHKKEVKYATIILVISILLSVKSPLSWLISETNVLGLRAAVAARALFLSAFAFSILGAFGLEKLRDGAPFKQSVRLLYIPTIILVSIIAATYSSKIWLTSSLVEFANHKEAFDLVNQWVRNLHIAFRNSAVPLVTLAVAGSLILLSHFRKFRSLALLALTLTLFLELFRFGHKYITFSRREYLYPQSKITDFLISKKSSGQPFRVLGGDVIPMNMFMPYGLETASGYEAVYPETYAKFLGRATSGDTGGTAGRYGDIRRFESDLIDKANVKYILGLKRDNIAVPSKTGKPSYRFDLEKLKPVFEDGSVVVFENTLSYPRAYMTVNGNIVDASVSYENYTPRKSVIRVNSPTDGMLIISDQFYPGWFAKVDGVETEMKPVEDVFRGIDIKAGNHVVETEYKPKSFYNGLKLSLASLIVLAISILFLRRRHA